MKILSIQCVSQKYSFKILSSGRYSKLLFFKTPNFTEFTRQIVVTYTLNLEPLRNKIKIFNSEN